MKIESDFVTDSIRLNLTKMFTDKYEEVHFATDSGFIRLTYDESGSRMGTKVYGENGKNIILFGKTAGFNNNWWPDIKSCIKDTKVVVNESAFQELVTLGLVD